MIDVIHEVKISNPPLPHRQHCGEQPYSLDFNYSSNSCSAGSELPSLQLQYQPTDRVSMDTNIRKLTSSFSEENEDLGVFV
jgi:hypothetical protein